jgi:dienelactone hydrolase
MHVSLFCAMGLLAMAGAALSQVQPEGLGAYFDGQTRLLETKERGFATKAAWEAEKGEQRRQLAEMLGLDPLPDRTDLNVVKTGEFEHEGIVVEKLHFQSRPGLYVTANLYRPKAVTKPLPTVLYVCGHAVVVKGGVSMGNKAGYEHHGTWYAKHGFVCLIIDTVQLGEIRGEHHGTYRFGKWWWMARGYTPAGVETWAGMRALDYLETRPEVDRTKFGVAGRSGGGAYSWFIAALDERIKCAVPTAGITDLRNHVVDGCVSGHCDCMFFVNTYRWDYDQLAALVAPRPLLVTNTDKDRIFPVDGVFRIYQSTRRLYKMLGEETNIGLHIAEGPHQDLHPLNVGEFHWMMRHLKGAGIMSTLEAAAVKSIPAEQLRVFQELPKDERNTRIDETFVPLAAAPAVPEGKAEWGTQRDAWLQALKSRSFAGWAAEGSNGAPAAAALPVPVESSADGMVMKVWKLPAVEQAASAPQEAMELYLVHGEKTLPQDLDLVVLNVLDDEGWRDFRAAFGSRFPAQFAGARGDQTGQASQPDEAAYEAEKKMHAQFKWGMAYVSPRGTGGSSWNAGLVSGGGNLEKEQTHILRRYYVLGQTLEGQQVWDIRRALAALRRVEGMKETSLWLQASRRQAANALYASLFEDGIARLDLHSLPASHAEGPVYLNVLKYLDIPQAVAMAAERARVVIYSGDQAPWQYARVVSESLGWGKESKNGLQLRPVPSLPVR